VSEQVAAPRVRAGRIVTNLPETVLVLLVVATLLDMLASTVWRYVVGQAIYWAEEVGVIGLVWMTMIGSAVAVKRHAHFTMPNFLGTLGPRVQLTIALFSKLLVFLIGCLLVVTGAEITRSSVTMLTPALEANMAVIDSASIVGGALIILYAGQQLVEMVKTGVPTASGQH
jgi:TRAP-type transport system small permease protein